MDISDFVTDFVKKYHIGYHTKKEKTLMKTIENYPISDKVSVIKNS